MALVTHSRSERPDVRWRPPTQIQHCLGAVEYCCSDDVTLFEWARLWVDHESVSTVAELDVAEAVRCTAIVDKDVVRFNVYGVI